MRAGREIIDNGQLTMDNECIFLRKMIEIVDEVDTLILYCAFLLPNWAINWFLSSEKKKSTAKSSGLFLLGSKKKRGRKELLSQLHGIERCGLPRPFWDQYIGGFWTANVPFENKFRHFCEQVCHSEEVVDRRRIPIDSCCVGRRGSFVERSSPQDDRKGGRTVD